MFNSLSSPPPVVVDIFCGESLDVDQTYLTQLGLVHLPQMCLQLLLTPQSLLAQFARDGGEMEELLVVLPRVEHYLERLIHLEVLLFLAQHNTTTLHTHYSHLKSHFRSHFSTQVIGFAEGCISKQTNETFLNYYKKMIFFLLLKNFFLYTIPRVIVFFYAL